MDKKLTFRFWGAVLPLTAAALFFAGPSRACTTAVVSAEASRTGRPMIWKQRDMSRDFNAMAHIRGEKYAYTALVSSLKDYSRVYAGINEAGFAIANNVSYNVRPDSITTTPANGALMAEALGVCASLDEFAVLLDVRPRPMDLSSNFAVIDAFGGAAYFEVSDTAYVRFDAPKGGYLVRTNFSVSGDSDRGAGYARYETMEWQMTRKSVYDAGFFMNVGRSFVNPLAGGDALKGRRSGYFINQDYIPRSKTTASVVIEGVAQGERPDSGLLWCAVGNTPCSYAIPVWVASGEEMPSPVCGKAPASLLASELKQALSPLKWPGSSEYVSVKGMRKVLAAVRKFEAVELREGAALDRKFRSSGFDPAAVREYNAAAARRFEAFRKAVEPVLKGASEASAGR